MYEKEKGKRKVWVYKMLHKPHTHTHRTETTSNDVKSVLVIEIQTSNNSHYTCSWTRTASLFDYLKVLSSSENFVKWTASTQPSSKLYEGPTSTTLKTIKVKFNGNQQIDRILICHSSFIFLRCAYTCRQFQFEWAFLLFAKPKKTTTKW